MTQAKEIEFYKVEDVMKMLDVKESKAYQVIKELNDELKVQGKIVIAGRVSAKYFKERIY